METLVAYLISVGLVAFGLAIAAVGIKTASGWLLVWLMAGLVPALVGILSLLNEVRNGRQQY
jgi:hypothetical protein